ncbi:MAG: hypothetical protein WDM76_06195 [Limisphaerales bacterium]
MILVLDNYDSFTYNLVQYLGELGVDVLVKRNDEISIEEIRALKPERILVSPGPCSPRESGLSNEVIHTFSQEGIPIFGVLPWTSVHRTHIRRGCSRELSHDARQNFAN